MYIDLLTNVYIILQRQISIPFLYKVTDENGEYGSCENDERGIIIFENSERKIRKWQERCTEVHIISHYPLSNVTVSRYSVLLMFLLHTFTFMMRPEVEPEYWLKLDPHKHTIIILCLFNTTLC